MLMFHRPPRCSECGGEIKPGQRMTVTTTGVLDKVGGAGIMRDQLILSEKATSFAHEERPCPR